MRIVKQNVTGRFFTGRFFTGRFFIGHFFIGRFFMGCLFMVFSCLALPALADITIEKIGPDLDHPWGMAALSDDEMLVTTRPGYLVKIAANTGNYNIISNPPKVAHWGQGGLLDVAIKGKDIFLCYAKPTATGATTAIDKARLNHATLQGRITIFTAHPSSSAPQHFGCRLEIKDDRIYASLGDRGNRAEAQNPASHNGSIIRLHLDGTIPKDNPKYDGWAEEIYSIGHRNPQGLATHPITGHLFSHEHGPQGGDEINMIQKGENYGWPLVSFGKEYGTDTPVSDLTTHPDMIDPVWVWTPSIAPSGMAYYPTDAAMFEELQGHLLVGSLKFKQLIAVRLDDKGIPTSQRIILDGTLGRIRDVAIASDGAILILNDAPKPWGGLYRLSQ